VFGGTSNLAQSSQSYYHHLFHVVSVFVESSSLSSTSSRCSDGRLSSIWLTVDGVVDHGEVYYVKTIAVKIHYLQIPLYYVYCQMRFHLLANSASPHKLTLYTPIQSELKAMQEKYVEQLCCTKTDVQQHYSLWYNSFVRSIINQSIISRHSTEARATVRLCRIKEKCLKADLKCVNGWSSSTVQWKRIPKSRSSNRETTSSSVQVVWRN